MPRRLHILFLTIMTACSAQAAQDVGFRQTTLKAGEADRPLDVAIWYPTLSGQGTVVVGDTPAFPGLPVVRDAAAVKGAHPLVLLSHGYGGSWRNLAWLATALAGSGYIVAAPDHPGTTTFNMRPEQAARLWKRPQDLSHVIDAIAKDVHLAGDIDMDRIAAIGHSLGGWTVAALAGGRFAPERIMTDCGRQSGAVSCTLFSKLGMLDASNATELQSTDMQDLRIRAVATLDLGPARGFTPTSLAAIRVPFLVIAAGQDIDLDTATKAKVAATNKDSAYLAANLPPATTTYRPIADALHFSFMQICKPGAAALIDEETPGDGIVCRDGGKRDREAIHNEVLDLVSDFLAHAIPAK
jgi:predicted dienelactone hydrolase